MIKALAHDQEGKPIAFLGIDARGIELLMDGHPIHVNLAEMQEGLDVTLVILYGKDQEALKDQLLGKNQEASVGKEKHDMPLSIRQEFMKDAEKLIGMVDELSDRHPELEDAITKAKSSLSLMKKTTP